jgi:hypothetical protein
MQALKLHRISLLVSLMLSAESSYPMAYDPASMPICGDVDRHAEKDGGWHQRMTRFLSLQLEHPVCASSEIVMVMLGISDLHCTFYVLKL